MLLLSPTIIVILASLASATSTKGRAGPGEHSHSHSIYIYHYQSNNVYRPSKAAPIIHSTKQIYNYESIQHPYARAPNQQATPSVVPPTTETPKREISSPSVQPATVAQAPVAAPNTEAQTEAATGQQWPTTEAGNGLTTLKPNEELPAPSNRSAQPETFSPSPAPEWTGAAENSVTKEKMEPAVVTEPSVDLKPSSPAQPSEAGIEMVTLKPNEELPAPSNRSVQPETNAASPPPVFEPESDFPVMPSEDKKQTESVSTETTEAAVVTEPSVDLKPNSTLSPPTVETTTLQSQMNASATN